MNRCGAAWAPPVAPRSRATTIGTGSRPIWSGSTGNSADRDRRLVSMTTLLLAQDSPPMGGGIARLHGELAKRFPRGDLVVSTPADPDASEVDSGLPAIVDRLPIGVRRTKRLPAVLFWSRRAASLARQHRVRFVHCGNVKPAGYPARWVHERLHIPYGIFFHGADLLSEQHKIRHSRLKRRMARVLFGGAAVLMTNSALTRGLALSPLGGLGLDGVGPPVRAVDPRNGHTITRL